ncbi:MULTISPECIES: sigma-54 dependent transcriptional regulator [unclassified Methylophaga]|jgi:two-component system response regulator PilR (NtrC family)|uniref:sigma-54-dependent transcriptional regulator n=3 Tax=Methylophaga TaxID=40222 RepID=UPI000C95BC67|nr:MULTISPECIES: sigma-54 dependent transcriptional regulator [unclassified Methylophaga]MAK67252.1 sigma-54-dependent Fis family transcriptional regulator [Methylophaga sp.]MAY18289.1 sigma-54-dependent Fis family transcriptional regulator [Methylophaga sp.]MBN47279.1 sigma-54-dependent Fis family transcriptional regulator [Methylophaga sp.]HAO26173.1 sigma-54-dependent Fis family transcriptional regulator [Methylophaga sp.]HCD05081.1 sigma-54-dependent Fis family transcriptional regulator [M|tara:strand:+ start:3595 stop:4962 length:1368 start_codon:yes stop_codon:yes gene_type:complete
MNPQALIVDDEPDILDLLSMTLSGMSIDCVSAETIAEAERLLSQQSFDLCFTDMRLPDGDGLQLVKKIQESHPDLPVAVITAYGNMDLAVTALKSGAFDFVSKPLKLQVLRELVEAALKLSPNRPHKIERRSRDRLLGETELMRELRGKVAKLARSQAPVYISGESGTGKELVARLIHDLGARSEKAFVPVNCGAIPNELVESEFFGHKKGAFTGAVADKQGLFQHAHGGTLFLDEVADLPLMMQVKLLRAIQEKAIRPVGGHDEINVDVRILSATHKNLAECVEKGTFRQDLFYRLNVIELHVPPLRERQADIQLLAEHILKKLAGKTHSAVTTLTAEAMTALQQYPFPGNVRELENTLERALTWAEGTRISAEDLMLPAITQPNGNAFTIPETGISISAPALNQDLESHLEEQERAIIEKALNETRWNKTAAAKRLGITFRALRYKLKKLDLE